MYNLEYIKIENFLSFKQAQFHLTPNQNTMIYAVNKDDSNGSDSNGSGKSNLVKAICVGILGVYDKSIPLEDFVHYGEKQAILELVFSNNLKQQKLTIKRQIFASKNKSNKIQIFVNNVENTQITTEIEGNKFVLELLDIQKDDLLNYFIINQENSHSFFSESDSKQKAIISRFTDVDVLDLAVEQIKQQLIVLRNQRQNIFQNLYVNNSKIEELQELQTDSHYQSSLNEQQLKIDKCEQELDNLNIDLQAIEQELLQTNEQLQVHLIDFDDQLSQDLINLKSENRLLKNSTEEAIDNTNAQLRKAKLSLQGGLTCPSCFHKFIPNSNQTIQQIEQKIEQINIIVNQKQLELQRLIVEQKEIDESLEIVSEASVQINELKNKIKKINQNKEFVLQQIQSKISFKKQLEEQIREIAKIDFSPRIDFLTTQNQHHQNELESVEAKISEQVFWEQNFGLNGLKTFIINKVLKDFEGYLNYYLKQFKIGLIVRVDGYKKLASGEVREKINITVSKNYDDFKPYRSFSGGQRVRLNLCALLTIQRLINQKSKSGGLNLLILDETFEGLDTKGQQAILSILENCQVTNLVISHNNNQINCQNKIVLTMENKITTL